MMEALGSQDCSRDGNAAPSPGLLWEVALGPWGQRGEHVACQGLVPSTPV